MSGRIGSTIIVLDSLSLSMQSRRSTFLGCSAHSGTMKLRSIFFMGASLKWILNPLLMIIGCFVMRNPSSHCSQFIPFSVSALTWSAIPSVMALSTQSANVCPPSNWELLGPPVSKSIIVTLKLKTFDLWHTIPCWAHSVHPIWSHAQSHARVSSTHVCEINIWRYMHNYREINIFLLFLYFLTIFTN